MKQFHKFFHTYLRRVPSAWLLLVQLLILISLPWFNDSLHGQLTSWVLGSIALLMVALVIRNSPIFTGIGLVLVMIALLLSATSFLTSNPMLLSWAHIFEAAAYFYAAAGMVMYMFQDNIVTRDELFAVAAVFTLLVWGFAFLYSVCQQWHPGSFTGISDSEAPRTWLELLFLSFAILSGVGLTDILPVSSPARVLTAIEMFGGVMYLTMVVTSVLSMMRTPQSVK